MAADADLLSATDSEPCLFSLDFSPDPPPGRSHHGFNPVRFFPALLPCTASDYDIKGIVRPFRLVHAIISPA